MMLGEAEGNVMADKASCSKALIRRPIARISLALMLAASSKESLARPAWSIDPARTHILFSIDAIGYPKTTGEFKKFEGHIVIDLDDPRRSRVNFQVKADSVEVGSASLNEYLRSDVLLNASHFPDISFDSTSVEKIDKSHARVLGELTMLGVSRPLDVVLEIQSRQGQDHLRLGFVAQAKIDRLAFGMNSGFPVISREIDLTVASEAFD
jgi:polyisoprenoid-binding protein YceI